ncbi:MAG TPA: MarR family transcriptional regulator [Rhizomicrobium sp.]|nr:MarR family transcriptional regulator [Rhizomicrobium sp.]
MIHDVSRLRRNAFDRLMRPLGVTRSQWWVLATLWRNDGMTQTELAEVLDVGKVTLGGLIDRLEAGGWVVRRADKGDRRVKRVYLTGSTDELLKQMGVAEIGLSEELLQGISPAECDKLFDVLTRMKDNLIKLGAASNRTAEEDENI